MARKVIFEQHPIFLKWIEQKLDRPAPYDSTARTLAHVEEKEDGTQELLAVIVFCNWTLDNKVEVSIASDGSKRWATRAFFNAVYQQVFVHCRCRRMHMVVAVENTDAINMHRKLGHKEEGYHFDWFGEDKDAISFGFTKRQYEKSRWYKWRKEQEKE